MTKQFNPFHEWLGFDESVTKPHHFQLLGVKTLIEDPIGFRKKVHTRAKKLLNMLESMSDEQIGSRTKLHIKLRKHIVKAHDILLDDKQRKAYLKSIRAKSRQNKDSKPLETAPPLLPSPSQLAATKKSSSARKSPGTKTRKRESPGSQPAIPMAVPLSKQPDPPTTVAVAHEVESEKSLKEELRVQPPPVRRKSSLAVPVLCILMLILSVAGLVYLAINLNFNAFSSNDDRTNKAGVVNSPTVNGEAVSAD